MLDVLLTMGRRRVVPSARPGYPEASRSATSAAAVMALGFGVLGWMLSAPVMPLLVGHEHHDAYGAHYRHLDGSEGIVLGLASAAVLAAVAWAITLAVTLPPSPRSRPSSRREGDQRWVAAVPAVLFLTTQVSASDSAGVLPLLLGSMVQLALGAGALALARRCTDTLTDQFALPRLGSATAPNAGAVRFEAATVGRSRPARAALSCRAPPLLPAL